MVQTAFVPRQPDRDDAAIQDDVRNVFEQDALGQGRQAIRRGAYPAEIMSDNAYRWLATLILVFLTYAVVDTWQEKRLKRQVAELDDLMHRIAMVQAKQLDYQIKTTPERFIITNNLIQSFITNRTLLQTNYDIILDRLKHRWHEGEPEPIFWHTIDIGLQANADLVWRPHITSRYGVTTVVTNSP